MHSFSDRKSAYAPLNAVHIGTSYQDTLNASGAHPHRTPDKTSTSREASKATILYWCTICDIRRCYKNLSDWRKHEKEHVDKYVCMLRGPREESEAGFKCTLCGMPNPSGKHLGTHMIHLCGQGVPGSFSCKRRADLVKHLKNCHNVQGKAQGEAIADEWKETTQKQAWSCGFCTHLDHTFGDRLRHLATHFERGQTLEEWDTTKVMEGLLSQPGMASVWKNQMADSSLGWEPPTMIWEKHLIKELQHDLEVGPVDMKHAEALAKRAYEAGQLHGRSLNFHKPFVLEPIPGVLRTSSVMRGSDYDTIIEQDSNTTSNHDLSHSVANPAETLHYGISVPRGNTMATSEYSTLPASYSKDGESTIQAPWLQDPGQTLTSAADHQYIDSAEYGYQEHSNSDFWPTPRVFCGGPDSNDTL